MFRRIEDNFSGAAAFIPISEGIAVAVELSLSTAFGQQPASGSILQSQFLFAFHERNNGE
jgi:hypothetical protein